PEVERQIKEFCAARPLQRRLMPDLEPGLYFALMRAADVMVGNSSSGFYEAPSLGKRFVNIGERQRGRFAPENIISVAAKADLIHGAMVYAIGADHVGFKNPYGDGHAAERIAKILDNIRDPQCLLRKRFPVSILSGNGSTKNANGAGIPA